MKTKRKLWIAMLLSILGALCIAQTNESENPSVETDSEEPTVEEKRRLILTPDYYTDWLGAEFFTIATIEKEFDVEPIKIVGWTFFYDFGSYFIGMKANDIGVVYQMSFRFFGDRALDFIQQAVDYGYKYSAKGENMNVHKTSGSLLPDMYKSKVKQYRKKTENGSVYIEVATKAQEANTYEFTIYRAK